MTMRSSGVQPATSTRQRHVQRATSTRQTQWRGVLRNASQPNQQVLVKRAVAIAAVVIVVVLPAVIGASNVSLVVGVLILGVAGLSMTLLTGLAGQISLGGSAFLALGALCGVVGSHLGNWGVVLAILLAAALGAVVGALVGLPSLRLKGIYLIIATLALFYIVVYIFTLIEQDTGHPSGFVIPPLQVGSTLVSNNDWYYIFAVLFGAVAWFVQRVKVSAPGRAMRAMMHDELVAASLGVNIRAFKIIAFIQSSVILAVVGALQAYYLESVDVNTYTLTLAIELVAIVVIGGADLWAGALAGAAVFGLLPTLLESIIGDVSSGANLTVLPYEVAPLIYGALLTAVLVLQPRGLVGLFDKWASTVRRKAAVGGSDPRRRADASAIRDERP